MTGHLSLDAALSGLGHPPECVLCLAADSRPLAQALGISRWRARRLMQTCQLVSKQPGQPKFRRALMESTVAPNQLNRAF